MKGKKITRQLTGISMIAAFGVFGLVACNSDDYKTDSSDHKADSIYKDGAAVTAGSDKDAAATQNMASDAAKDKAPGSAASADNATSKTAASAKKRKASITWPGTSSSERIVKDKDGIYNTAQEMPQFPGGQGALATYVNDNIDYSQGAIDDNAMGTVRISFVIDENGKVTRARLANGDKVGKGLDEAALRVVNRMPNWKPGKVNGKNVKTRLELPINFQLEA